MRTLVLSVLTAVALAGCSSSSSDSSTTTTAATKLTYTDPSATGWRLVKDPTSTSKRVVLALVGPAGTQIRGVGFNLQAGSGARWSIFADGQAIQDTGVLELRNSTPPVPNPYEDVLLGGGVMEGNILTVGIFQKDRRVTAKDVTAPLLRIALELDPTAAPGSIPLALKKAKVIPGDIGAFTDDPVTVLSKAHMDVIDIAVGKLQAS